MTTLAQINRANDTLRARIVGSGFARTDTVCACGCGRTIGKGWEAWVTAWNDDDTLAYFPHHYRS
jgi:hypothetical protein